MIVAKVGKSPINWRPHLRYYHPRLGGLAPKLLGDL